MDGTQLPPSVEDDPGDVTGSPRPELLWTKLVAPAPRAGLQSLLQSSLQAKLCLVGAPAGSGKTTLLAQWRAVAGGGRVAWVSLEESDNDPTRFWSYLVAALRTVEPGVGTVALEALGGPSVELERVVRSLVNDLATVGASLVLVLDDYQLITEAICHQTLGWFLDQLPPAVHVVLSTRVDPPLPLALERQPEELRVFLLRTSVLERLSGPLCDAVLEAQGSAELLRELEASNLFVVPLDDRRQWYRYHQLFADLLRLQLGVREPGLVPVLHRRAAAWHRQAGNIDEAIHHASAAGDFAEAGVLIARHWATYWLGGQRATVARWLDGLPEAAITADPPVAVITAWSPRIPGRLQAGHRTLAGRRRGPKLWGAAAGRHEFPGVRCRPGPGHAGVRRRRALGRGGPPRPGAGRRPTRGELLGGVGARPDAVSVGTVRRGPAAARGPGQPGASNRAAVPRGHRAGGAVTDRRRPGRPRRRLPGPSCGRHCERTGGQLRATVWDRLSGAGSGAGPPGGLAEAEEQLERALALFDVDAMAVHRGLALLALASVRHGRGDLPGARTLVDQARGLIDQFTDPGMLPALLEQAEEGLGPAPPPRVAPVEPLTERELTVLRLLPTQLRTPEIARELSVSVNTIRSQVQAIYRKLQVSSRAEAVTRARQLDLLP
jgi:LuxR family maltose regulon positive regulatory protein